MARKYECDFCGASIAVESAITPIKVGDKVVGEACFNCAANWETGINTAKMENARARAAQEAKAKPAPEELKKPEVQVQPNHEPTEPVQATGAGVPAANPATPK